MSTAFQGGTAGKGWNSVVLQSVGFLSLSANQKVENVIFGLAVFAEGQSGLVPKTRQWSQPNLGKYSICTRTCTHIHTNTRTYKWVASTHNGTHTHTQAHMMQTNKQTNRRPGFLCLSLFVAKNTCGDTRHFPTEHHRLSAVRIQLAYSSFSSFQRAVTAPCMKES